MAEATALAADGRGGFDATGAWVPLATTTMAKDGSSYDATGAWIPPTMRSKEEPKDVGAEFEAKLKSIIAKAQLQDALKQVAPKKAKKPAVEKPAGPVPKEALLSEGHATTSELTSTPGLVVPDLN